MKSKIDFWGFSATGITSKTDFFIIIVSTYLLETDIIMLTKDDSLKGLTKVAVDLMRRESSFRQLFEEEVD